MTLIVSALLVSSTSNAADAQVILRADKTEYIVGERISLIYDTLWLGSNEGQLYFSNSAFPEIEVLYLNRFPVEITETGQFELEPQPGRHEQATFAPTMNRVSTAFAINEPEKPIRFLDGKEGYYELEKRGTYVIRATFRFASQWKLYEGQDADIQSTALVIRVVE